MTDAYRDDLEAALARVSDLEREVEALRERNAELEAGDSQTVEARENARRLAAALERERAELRQQHQREVDDAHWSQASRDEANATKAANTALVKRLTTALVKRREVTTAEVMIGTVGMVGGGMAGVVAAIVNSEPIGAIALVMFLVGAAAVVGMIGRPPSA
jgi:chromosome segregation ATPase